ncbi:hypothetical protein OJAV_G00082330 [Oryzias javanicus]|uniref:C2 domain-containing protein n=1 Tax=Oryzias javanicus TaxID=123683 RepID=A0A437D5H0_ORYJA|nr:hypothetical protein OJAV_G00082330 [Oryzias javanicus]
MFPRHIFIFTLFLFCFPRHTLQLCTDGTPKDCQEAEFAPGSNLAGEGFDITKMECKGAFVLDMNQWKRKDKACTLCSNPYLENKRQKLPLSVVDWRAKHACSGKVSSKLHKSSESLVDSSTSSVENNWKVDLEINGPDKSGSVMLAGTQSKLAEYAMEKTKNDKFTFSSNSITCEYYSYRVSSGPRMHREFRKAIKELPKEYSQQYKKRFTKFIDKFGTHYITKVKLGGKVNTVTSIRQCEASLQGLTSEEVQMCLEAEASANLKVNAKAEVKHCKKDTSKMENKQTFSDLFRDRLTEIRGGHTTEPDLLFSANKNPSAYKEWLTSVPQYPDILSYSLDSLHELLSPKDPVRKNLRSAISHYILEKGLMKNCSEPCKAGIKSDSRDSCICQCHNEPAVNPDCCPTRKGMARVIVTIQRALNLWGDHSTATDGYVKVLINNQQVYRSPVINNNNNPHWENTLDLGSQDLSSSKIVRFEVWDQDSGWDDDLLGACEQVLTSGVKQDVCAMQHGKFYYKWEVKCAPSLGGKSCMDYQPSPMNQNLRKLYTSRHAHPIPESVLLKMGVFVDESRSSGNLTHNFN